MGENGNGSVKIPRPWFSIVIGPLIVAAVLGFAGWGWWLQSGHAEQANHLTKHDGQIGTLERDSDRVISKLDEILRELRK